MSSRSYRWRTIAAAAAAALAGSVLGAPAASAEPIFNYDIPKGETIIKKLGSSLELGPGALVVDLDGATGNFTADMSLPPAQGEFKVLGLLPTTSTVTMTQVGAITGTLIDGKVNARANVSIRLSDVKTAGLPLFVGENCKTKTPAVIDLVSVAEFNPLEGGDLTGTYTIPEFTDCGLSTLLLNGLIPGPGNTITLTLTIRW